MLPASQPASRNFNFHFVFSFIFIEIKNKAKKKQTTTFQLAECLLIVVLDRCSYAFPHFSAPQIVKNPIKTDKFLTTWDKTQL